MKNTTCTFLIFLLITAGLASCEKSKNFIATESSPTGKQYPVCTNALVDIKSNTAIDSAATSKRYAPGDTVKTELQFFSLDPVKEINLYATAGSGARTRISNYPYAAAYSSVKKLDTLLVPYIVPAGTASATKIKLEYEILNINTLGITRTAYFKVQ